MTWLGNTPFWNPYQLLTYAPLFNRSSSTPNLILALAFVFFFPSSFFILAVFISVADPLSILASIAGLVALADLIFRSGTKYVKSYRGASTEVGNLIREIRSLSVILHNLSLVAFDLEETEPTAAVHESSSVLQPHYLHDCHQLLRRLETGLSRTEASLDSGSEHQRLYARLKWPFTSTESKEMIQDVQRYNQIIHTALAADSLAMLKHCLSRQDEIKNGLDKISLTAERILEIQVKISHDAKRNQVLRDFGRVNPRGEYETNRKLRQGRTGLWLTQGPDFDFWYSTPGSRLWCSGIPGAGKSVLAVAMTEECLQRNAQNTRKAVAYFFCTYKNESSQHSTTILSSLCMQLEMQSESAFQILQEYHDQLFSGRDLSARPTAETLAQKLHLICACFTRTYIIVDGLDECDHRVAANVECLAKLSLLQGYDVINMALSSRDEIIIRQRLKNDFPHVEIKAHNEDLQLYVASELSERIASKQLRLRDQITLALIPLIPTKAVSRFRWVACQLDYMCELPTDRARREALSKLPPSLYATYDRILLRIDGYDDTLKRLVKKAILMLATSFVSLSFEEICEAISLEEDATTLEDDEIVKEEELLRWCSSLVRVSKSGSFNGGKTRIQFAHFTVKEYLHSLKTRNSDHEYPQLKEYAVSHEDGIDFFSFLCLRFLTMEDIERFSPTRDTTRAISCILAQRRRRTFYEPSVLTWAEIFIELVKAGVSITAQDVQLFSIRYNQYLQMPSVTSETSQMWSRFPQFFNVLGNRRVNLQNRRKDTTQPPKEQSLDGASDEEVLAYIHSLIKLNDETRMNSFLSTRRAKLAQSTDIDPKHPGWNALHLALLERSYRVLDPFLAFGLDPRAYRPDGFKPVHMCCRENTCGALQALLRFGGSTLNTDNLGRTVWHLAAEMNSVTVMEELLDLGNVDVALNMTSKPHEMAICAAATRLHLEAVCLLLPFCKTEEYWTSSKALSLILYEPGFSEAMQSLHRFGILSQTSCGMRALAYSFH
ncbi:hypothetical protein FOWG_05576 [Fusarium oxysporum f. sp. lycopersici MN25]|nr:hypothetical protein FOWG_05576 [Fusarium oxysporum f. sp. lycopersici MN25]